MNSESGEGGSEGRGTRLPILLGEREERGGLHGQLCHMAQLMSFTLQFAAADTLVPGSHPFSTRLSRGIAQCAHGCSSEYRDFTPPGDSRPVGTGN